MTTYLDALFVAPDGGNEPTIWKRNDERPDYPQPLLRRCDGPVVFDIFAEQIEANA